MRLQELRSWNRKNAQGLKKGSAAPRRVQRMEPGHPLRGLIPWTASIHCGQCHGLMYRIQLRDGGRKSRAGWW